MYALVPKHKGTDHLRADMRRQLSKLNQEAQAQKKKGGHASTYHVEREGAGQAVLIGPSNVGKSALLAALTHAEPEVSSVPYTTWRPLPGMMPVMDIQVQLIDTPSMEAQIAEPGLFVLARQSDLALLVVDLQADPLQQIADTLLLLRQHRLAPRPRQGIPLENPERLTYLPFLVLVNKYDDESVDELFSICCELLEADWPIIPVSALTGRNFDPFKMLVFEQLGIVRVYAKPPGQDADLLRPFVLKQGGTVIDMARKVHRDFYEHLKFARVWGSVEFDGQMVTRDYVLHDGDIVELREK
jgi:ribosome-interacting GTPase 1